MDRRTEILEAAAKSFSLFGYKATTMEKVAKIANVGKRTIYTFFANKEELFNAIVVGMIEEMRAEAEAAAIAGGTFEENAHARLMSILKFRTTHQLYAKLIDEGKEIRTPAVQEVLADIEAQIVEFIGEKIQKGINRGEVKPCNVEMIAYLLFKSYMALVIDWGKTHGRELDETEIIDLLGSTIFKSLLI